MIRHCFTQPKLLPCVKKISQKIFTWLEQTWSYNNVYLVFLYRLSLTGLLTFDNLADSQWESLMSFLNFGSVLPRNENYKVVRVKHLLTHQAFFSSQLFSLQPPTSRFCFFFLIKCVASFIYLSICEIVLEVQSIYCRYN